MPDLGQAIAALSVLVLVAFLVACGRYVEPPEPSIDPVLDNTDWVLTSLGRSDLVEGSNITLSLAEGRVGGFGGCNSYGGNYTVADRGTLTIPQIEITLQLCDSPQGIMEQEEAYVEALRDAAIYRISDDQLEIVNATGEVSLLFTRRVEFAMAPGDLIGTEWKLLSWNGGSPLKGSIITIAFAEGKIHGHAGCRGYRGTYEAKGADIRFPLLEMAEIDCLGPEPLRLQEGEYTTCLEGATHYRLMEGQLEILTMRGDALVFNRLVEGTGTIKQSTTWVLTTFVEGERVTPVLADTQITAVFEGGPVRERRKVIGSAGCNTYSAAYSFNGFFFAFESPAATQIACSSPAAIMEQEQRYLNLLSDVTAYRVEGSQLHLKTNEERGLTFAVKAADYSLTDLIDDLRAAGVHVEPTGLPVDHGFAMKGLRVLIDGTPVFVYEFADAAAAETASDGVSVDQYSMTVTRVEGDRIVEVHGDWIETPHPYRRGRLIVISGDSRDVLNTLDSVLGPQSTGN